MRLKLRANTIASLDIRFPPGHYLRLDSISLQLSISLPSSSTPFLPTRFFPWAIYTNCYSPRICLDTSGCLLCQECFLYPAHDLVSGKVGKAELWMANMKPILTGRGLFSYVWLSGEVGMQVVAEGNTKETQSRRRQI